MKEKGVQATSTAFTVPFPDVHEGKTDRKFEGNSIRPATSVDKRTETIQPDHTSDVNDKASRRYLSHTWRVINPREDVEQNVRPENNSSSFFNKSYNS